VCVCAEEECDLVEEYVSGYPCDCDYMGLGVKVTKQWEVEYYGETKYCYNLQFCNDGITGAYDPTCPYREKAVSHWLLETLCWDELGLDKNDLKKFWRGGWGYIEFGQVCDVVWWGSLCVWTCVSLFWFVLCCVVLCCVVLCVCANKGLHDMYVNALVMIGDSSVILICKCVYALFVRQIPSQDLSPRV